MKAVNMKDPAVSLAFYTGKLVLQCGQWLDLHGDGDYSRFVSINATLDYVDAVHSNGRNPNFNKRFLFRARMSKLNKQLDSGKITHDDFRTLAEKVEL